MNFDVKFQENKRMLGALEEKGAVLYTGINELAGYESGRKAEYDAHWDALQRNGTLRTYDNMFAGVSCNNDIFNPKYDIVPLSAYMLFYGSGIEGDLVEILAKKGKVLDTSKCTYMAYAFSYMRYITRVGTVSFEGVSGSSYAANIFNSSALLETIDLIIPHPTVVINFTFFTGCTELKNVRFDGTIRGNVNFKDCPLTLESAISVLTHLIDLVETGNAGAYTVTFSSKTRTMLDNAGAIFNGMNWADYLDSIGWGY